MFTSEAIEIMGESVKTGVIIELVKSFPNIMRYREQITEPVFPHFFLEQLTLTANEERKNKWWLEYLMTIRYRHIADIALERNLQTELDAMSLALLAKLQTIRLGTLSNGVPIPIRNPRTEKNAGVLHYFCNFKFQVTKPQVDEIKMWHLKIVKELQSERK